MKLSELKGEEALDALAEMLEPASEIVTDVEVVAALRKGERMKAIKLSIKNHKKALIDILAASEGKSPEEYEVNLLTLPLKLLEVFNDPMVTSLFRLQSQTGDVKLSGSATENTEG